MLLRWLKPTRCLLSSFISQMSAILNTIFGIVLINLRDFLNIQYDSKLGISELNLFHSWIIQGKKELAKYSVY